MGIKKRGRNIKKPIHPNQISFKTIKIDKNNKWYNLKTFLNKLDDAFEEGRIRNQIDNHELVKKILKKMDIYEKQELS
jgi:translation elongation factor EF-1alpha